MNIAECTMRKRHIEERTQHRDNRDGWTGMDVNTTFEQLFDALSVMTCGETVLSTLLSVSGEKVLKLALAPSWVYMLHLLKLKCAHSPLNLRILSSTSVPYTLTTVQVPNLELSHKKRITVQSVSTGATIISRAKHIHIYICKLNLANRVILGIICSLRNNYKYNTFTSTAN